MKPLTLLVLLAAIAALLYRLIQAQSGLRQYLEDEAAQREISDFLIDEEIADLDMTRTEYLAERELWWIDYQQQPEFAQASADFEARLRRYREKKDEQ